VTVEYKGPDDPVTRADREASELIVRGFRSAFPGDGILTEELPDGPERLSAARTWIIDPMDGPKEFLNRNGEFSVLIGLAVGSRPALGVVYQPVGDLLYAGVVGCGARMVKGGKATVLALHGRVPGSRTRRSGAPDRHVPRRRDPAGAAGAGPGASPARLVLAVSRSHRTAVIDELGRLLAASGEVRSGSVGLKVGLIARGDCHAYVVFNDRTKEWDTCAPHALLEAAGGRMTDLLGRPLAYNRRQVANAAGVVATDGVCHDRVLAAVRPILASAAARSFRPFPVERRRSRRLP
jgi:3'(2'), 5'-bisphosphate nucleotidase